MRQWKSNPNLDYEPYRYCIDRGFWISTLDLDLPAGGGGGGKNPHPPPPPPPKTTISHQLAVLCTLTGLFMLKVIGQLTL
jgi:hypothetical protein